MHQAGNAVLVRSLDLEVGRGVLRAGGLGTDSRIARQERAVGQRRPVAPDGGVEALGAARVDRVVFLSADAVDPPPAGTEAAVPREVERHVHARAAGLGNRVDEPAAWACT